MRGSTLALVMIVVAAICFLLGIFYIIPGIYHPLTFKGLPTDSHLTHAIAFFAIAVLALIGSRFARSSAR